MFFNGKLKVFIIEFESELVYYSTPSISFNVGT